MSIPILRGLRVIDCATYIAGPCAATILSDFGADVIKIERPPHGDPYRVLSFFPGQPVTEENFCWILDSRNKRSLALNLADGEGRAVLDRLVASADVFITNFQPDLIEKFQIGWDRLRALNSRLIYAYVNGYGERGEEAGSPGYDTTAYWARSGLMYLLHNADAEPCRSPTGFGDHPTGVALFGAIMLALYSRERTGQGTKVSTSLMAAGLWSNSCQIQASLCGAQWPPRFTRKNTRNALVNHYLTADKRRLMLCLLDTVKDWGRLCRALGRPELIDDPRFATHQARSENSVELVAVLDEEFLRKPLSEWARLFRENEVLWGPVPSPDDLASDPQVEANGLYPFVQGVPKPTRTVDSPIFVENGGKLAPRQAPEVGEHTRQILAEAGYAPEEIERLIERGAAQALSAG